MDGIIGEGDGVMDGMGEVDGIMDGMMGKDIRNGSAYERLDDEQAVFNGRATLKQQSIPIHTRLRATPRNTRRNTDQNLQNVCATLSSDSKGAQHPRIPDFI